MEIPRVVHCRIAQLHVECHAQFVEREQVAIVVGRDDDAETDVLALGLLEFEHGAQGVVKSVHEAAFGVVDVRKPLHTHANEDVGVLVGQFHDFLGVVTVGAQLQKRSLGIQNLKDAVDVLADGCLSASDVDAEAIGQFLVERGIYFFVGVRLMLPNVAHIALGVTTKGNNQTTLFDAFHTISKKLTFTIITIVITKYCAKLTIFCHMAIIMALQASKIVHEE